MPTTLVPISFQKSDINIMSLRGDKHFGNPFSYFNTRYSPVKVATREEAVACHMQWLKGEAFHELEPERRKWILKNLERLRNKRLGCICGSQPCHGWNYILLLEGDE